MALSLTAKNFSRSNKLFYYLGRVYTIKTDQITHNNMKLRLTLLSGFALLMANAAFAQDVIHKRNGDVVEGRVKEVGKTTITYKSSDEVAAPSYEISKDDVKKIEYSMGSREKGRPENRRNRRGLNYGDNIIALAPLQVAEDGVGIGLSYERVLDKKGIVSFYFPIVWTFTGDGNDEYGYYGNTTNDLNNVYFMPGLKIYPTGSKGIVKYSIGPSLLFAVGEAYRDYGYYAPYYPSSSSYYPPYYPYTGKTTRFTFGMMINNTLNVNPTEHLFLGLELGLGVSYIHTEDNVRQDPIGLAQFGFKVGYRF
jgi:hypothetical protein